ncbi:MAG: flagellar hook basal-body protein [Vulcanimicrobiota bacterium]
MFDMNHQSNAIQYTQQRLNSHFSNMQNQFTPGYKAEQLQFRDLVTGYGGKGAMVQSGGIVCDQGQIVKNNNPTNLAIEGNGFFVVNDGVKQHYTRDGRFQFKNGELVNQEGLKVMGYQLDNNGNIASDMQPINLNFDPQTKLYGGKYTGFHFDSAGKMYGERNIVDPLTGKAVKKSVPLFQAAVGSFANPSGLTKTGNTSFGETENSGEAVIGTPGQGSLGRVHPGSLEMASVDFAQQAAAVGMAKQNYEANFAAFKSMDKLRQQAIGLIR